MPLPLTLPLLPAPPAPPPILHPILRDAVNQRLVQLYPG